MGTNRVKRYKIVVQMGVTKYVILFKFDMKKTYRKINSFNEAV